MSQDEVDRAAGSHGELSRRLMVAGVGIPLGVWLVYLGGWALGGLLTVVAAAGAREFFVLARSSGGSPLSWLGVPTAAALVLVTAYRPDFPTFALVSWTLALALTLGSLISVVWLRGPQGGPLSAASATVAGALYTGGGLSFALLVRHLPPVGSSTPAGDPWAGPALLLIILVLTWVGDTCAYIAGKRWGRSKLAPTISPNKTVVGGVAGLLGSVASAVLFAALLGGRLGAFGVDLAGAAVLGLVLGVGAQVGDLAESVLKREAGVKDSSSLLPGHGGILDRFDALLVNFPLGYGVIRLLGLLA